MDVIAGVIGRVELDNPVDLGDVETTGGDVRAEEYTGRGVAEFEEGVGALLLLLLALQRRDLLVLVEEKGGRRETHVKVEDRHVNVVEQLAVVLHRLARREEDDNLLLEVLAEEGEEEEEALVRLADDVTLLEVLGRRRVLAGVDVDVERAGAEGHAGEVGDLRGLGGGEEHRLTVLCGREGVSTRSSMKGVGGRTHPWEGG